MSANAPMIVLRGADLTNQPNTARHVAAAKYRGAYIVNVDVRKTKASAQADDSLIIRPAGIPR